MKKDDLIRLMEARGGRITTKAAREAGFSNTLLALLEREGSVERETRGVYALTTAPLDTFAIIALRWPKAVFSHGSALYLHGLSDRVPGRMDVTCPQGYQSPALLEEFPDTRIHTSVGKRFELGVQEGLSPTGTPIRLYDPERCICDLLRQRRQGKAELQLFSNALNAYMRSKEKNLPKLARYADSLGLSDDLRRYTEVLS